MPRIFTVDPVTPDPEVVREAALLLLDGKLVAFPTETVYGLGARGLDPEAVKRIFAAKGRPAGHPLILHVFHEILARACAADWPDLAGRLAEAFWPGPLTIVVRRSHRVPLEVTGGIDSVAIRMPAHPVAQALLRVVADPVAAPSANAHTHVSPTTAMHVVRSLGDRVDAVVDGGPCLHGIESTVVSLLDPEAPVILRPGAITLERLRTIAPAFRHEVIATDDDAPRASPGLASKHYAPRARVLLVDGARGVRDAFAAIRTQGELRLGAAITWSDGAKGEVPIGVVALPLPADPESYARGIYAALHDVDDAGADVVVIERVPADEAWRAIADRLGRAATS